MGNVGSFIIVSRRIWLRLFFTQKTKAVHCVYTKSFLFVIKERLKHGVLKKSKGVFGFGWSKKKWQFSDKVKKEGGNSKKRSDCLQTKCFRHSVWRLRLFHDRCLSDTARKACFSSVNVLLSFISFNIHLEERVKVRVGYAKHQRKMLKAFKIIFLGEQLTKLSRGVCLPCKNSEKRELKILNPEFFPESELKIWLVVFLQTCRDMGPLFGRNMR